MKDDMTKSNRILSNGFLSSSIQFPKRPAIAVAGHELVTTSSRKLGWPMTGSSADGIEVFLQTDTLDTQSLLEKLKAKLPLYMVLWNIRLLSDFPLNANDNLTAARFVRN
jgi:hypothetical protein